MEVLRGQKLNTKLNLRFACKLQDDKNCVSEMEEFRNIF
jgi:hypothetical protein